MDAFLAALSPALRGEIEVALEDDPDHRTRLTFVVGRYVDEDGNWPTEPATAEMLARQFLATVDDRERQFAGAGLAPATAAALGGAALSVGGAKGAVILSSNLLANYWQQTMAYAVGIDPMLFRALRRVVEKKTYGTDWHRLARDFMPPGKLDPSGLALAFGDNYANMLDREIVGLLKKHAWRGARSGINHLRGQIRDFAQENAWVENYVSVFSRNQRDLAERTIRHVVNASMEQGLPPNVLAGRLQQLWALTPRHAQAVENYRKNLMEQKRSARSVHQLTGRYSAKLLDSRLKAITATEALTVFNLGRESQWIKAVSEGRMPLDTVKMWVTAQDELVCKVCRPMDGTTAPLGQAFEGTVTLMVPSAHPNCRCIVIPVVGAGIADFSRMNMVFPAQTVAKKLVRVEEYEREDGTKVQAHFRHLKGVKAHDNDLAALKEGAYDMPMSWLRDHIRGSGIRIGQKNRIKGLANSILEDGFTKPITLWVYEDGPFVRDGMHRLEAAHMLGLKRIPVAIHHVEGERPTTDLRGRYHARRIQRQGELPLRDTPFRNVKQEEGFVRWFNERMAERGEQVAQNPDAEPKKKRQLLTKAIDEPPIRYVAKHMGGGTEPPGPHPSGSPQSVHGGGGGGFSETVDVASGGLLLTMALGASFATRNPRIATAMRHGVRATGRPFPRARPGSFVDFRTALTADRRYQQSARGWSTLDELGRSLRQAGYGFNNTRPDHMGRVRHILRTAGTRSAMWRNTDRNLVARVGSHYHGSTASNNTIHGIQYAAQRVLGIKGATTAHFARATPQSQRAAERAFGGVGYDPYIRAQYTATQKHLAQRNIREVNVMRGMTMKRADAEAMGLRVVTRPPRPGESAWQTVPMDSQPLNSVTTSPVIANRYATGITGTPGPDEVAVVMRRVAPAEEVFANYKTGLGMRRWQEWIVTGGKQEWQVVAVDPRLIQARTSIGQRTAVTPDMRRQWTMADIWNS
jgi:hypothetical protein